MTIKLFLNNGKTEEYPNSHIAWEWDESDHIFESSGKPVPKGVQRRRTFKSLLTG
jgi:hypothetical protein